MPDETPVMNLRLQPPKGYKIEDAEAWRKYKQLFNLYIQATDLENGTDEKKVAIFLTCAGEEILEVYNGMVGTSTLKWVELLGKFDDHFNNKTNTVVNSYRFYNLRQEPDEPVERFVLRLKNAAKTCNFKEEDRTVRDMLVIGVEEATIKERLLREKELSLDTAIELCKAAEYSKKNVKELVEKVQSVNMVKESSRYRKDVKKPIHYSCSYCGKKHEPRKCPAYGRRCTVCNIYNHYAEMCRFQKKEEKQQRQKRYTKNKVDGIRESTKDSDCSSEEFVVDSVSSSDRLQWYEVINVEGVDIKFKLDSGADCSTLPLELFESLKLDKCKLGEPTVLIVYNEAKMKTVGCVKLTCTVRGNKGCVRFTIVDMPVKPILGLPDCVNFNLIKRVDAVVSEEKNKFVKLNNDVFTGLGNIGTYSIKLKENSEPLDLPVVTRTGRLIRKPAYLGEFDLS